MEFLLILLAVTTLVYLILTILECFIGFYSITNLQNQTPLPKEQLPSVSIIFSALNEEKDLEKTLGNLLNINYPNLEIIAINDRSTDNTPAILEKFQRHFKALRIFHIDQLPQGWLGKNHALHFASQLAKGDWLLFTDADVLIKEPCISKAISYAVEKNLDHLTLYEHHLRKQFGLQLLLLGSYIVYSMEIKPWRARFAWSKKYAGHGAFNLVKKTAYFACDGHRSIAMECLDDMKLGHLLKSNGYRQEVVNGRDLVEREWYSSLTEMIIGFRKNSFAHFNFKFMTFIQDFIFAILFFFSPFIVAILFSGPLRWLNITNIFLTFLLSFYVASKFRVQKSYAICYPIAISMLLYSVCGSVISTYKNKGILWRGTHYPLKNLKNKKIHP